MLGVCEVRDNSVWGAEFSEDRKYRFALWRTWGHTDKGKVMFIGLNPSTANEQLNDPTIKRCINFAKSWGYGGMFMLNLYAYVSTDPKKLVLDENILKNNENLLEYSKKSDIVVFAWGCFKSHKKRMKEVESMFPDAYCINKSKDGFPCHPLFQKGDLKPIRYGEKTIDDHLTEAYKNAYDKFIESENK
ncbi:DUF1643 domain-containing protein [Flavobacterium filum]|uniref:DUF1643 domain-containing protein n=1 Tax=Flavobacterium filum TaxID=370974 RepID=UPI0023F31CE8|nr:DUF1643 domain-containing protein [Flavobacterium filum]